MPQVPFRCPSISAVVTLTSLAVLLGCGTRSVDDMVTAEPPGARLADFVPAESSGRRPAGTTDDPFVGDAVVVRVTRSHRSGSTRLVLRMRAIPYFRVGSEAPLDVPDDLARGVSDGDIVRLYFANDRPASATTTYRWFGYSLFAINVVPDSDARQNDDEIK
jgi:hypothetical protein